MRIVRFSAGRRARYGALAGDTVRAFRVSPFSHFHGPAAKFEETGETHRLSDVRLLAPSVPSKIVCLGLNYRRHAAELKQSLPQAPLIFLKPPSAVIAPGEAIVLPPDSGQVDYEGELAVVIGRMTRRVPAETAGDSILGYTCFNDVTERIAQKEDGQWTRAKGYDTFAPFGPWIETGVVPGDLGLETRVNGVLKQSGRTRDMLFSISTAVSFISNVMTLMPGDVVATGTPAGIGPLHAGDVVEVTIEGIGTLRNPVISS